MTDRYEINPGSTLMLGVDLQTAFGEAVVVPDVAAAVENARRALNHWRPLGSIVLTRHLYNNPSEVGRLDDFLPGIFEALRAGSPLAELYDGVQGQGDRVIDKTRFSALVRTPLAEILEDPKIETVVGFGLTTPICVESTLREAMMRYDKKVILLHDACASQALGELSPQEAHIAARETMGALFAQLMTTDEFIKSI